jgi:hypothetical protein
MNRGIPVTESNNLAEQKDYARFLKQTWELYIYNCNKRNVPVQFSAFQH